MDRLIKWSKLSRPRLLKLIECFCLDIEASKTAVLLRLYRNTGNRHYTFFHRFIFAHQLAQLRRFVGVVEADESYFGPTRLRGRPGARRRGRGTFKQPVFGIYERQGCVYTQIEPKCSVRALAHSARQGRSSVVLTDDWRGYDGSVGFEETFVSSEYGLPSEDISACTE